MANTRHYNLLFITNRNYPIPLNVFNHNSCITLHFISLCYQIQCINIITEITNCVL